MKNISQDELKAILHYAPDTGKFTWVADGAPAGHVTGTGYMELYLGTVQYLLHRLAFVYMGYEMPKTVDHKDHDTTNNVWTNLRPATYSQNLWNCKLRKDSTTGVKGVSFNKEKNAFDAYFNVHGKRIRCGRFATLEEAANVVRAEREKYHGEFVCHG